MSTIRLIPSTYEVSSTNLSVSSTSNMYANTDSTNYATVTNTQKGTTAYYIYLRGFNFSDVPSNSIVNSITIKLKASHNSGNTGTIYCYNETTQVSTAGSTTALGTTATVKTFTNTTIAWDTLKGYGSNFGIGINCKRSKNNTEATFNIYGAEILVDYTLIHNVYFNNTSSVSISPSTTQSVLEGSDLTIQINTSNKNVVRVSDNNVDVSSQIVQGTSSCTYTISNIQANHTISVTDAPSYNVSITNDSETITTQPFSTQTLFEGESQSISFYNISSLDDIEIVDNSNDIIDSLVYCNAGTHSTSVIPNSLISGNNVSNANNGLTDETSTTYAEIVSNTENYLIYSFETPIIPYNAVITSVSCIAKVQHTRIYTPEAGEIQLYSGPTPKGSLSTFKDSSSNTTSTVTLDTGTWTYEELNDIRIRIGTNYNSNDYYLRFYGATFTVNYTLSENTYVYEIHNISADHLIEIGDLTEYYLISGTSTLSDASFTNLPKKIGPKKYGTDYLVNLTGISNVYSFVLYDNEVNVTRFVDNYQYPIQNINEDHVLLIEEANYFSVTGSSSVSGVSITGTSNKVYEGNSITVTITGVSNIYAIKLSDNNVEVSANIEYVNNSYQYTIEDIDRNHTLTISQQDRVTITTSSSYSGATLTSSVSSIYKGESATLTLNVSNIDLVSVRVNNNTMITGLFEGNGPYTCTLTDIRENLSIVVIEKITYNITATDNSSFGNITPTGTITIDAGYKAEYFISSEYFDRIYLKDNGVIVNDSIEQHYEHDNGTANTVLGNYTLVSGSFYSNQGATFFSELVGKGENSSTTTSNYYSSGSGSSTVVFNYDLIFTDIPSDAIITRLYVRVNGHAESTTQNSEYMCAQLVIGDTAISDELNFKNVGTSNSTQTIEATTLPTVAQLSNLKLKCRLGYYGGAINGATCYIEYYTEDEYYSYTISNISEAHTLVLSDRPTYQLTSSSTAQNGTITPSSITVYERNSVTFVIDTNDIFTVSLSDNGANVTENIVYEGGEFKYVIESVEGTHTLILNDKAPDTLIYIKVLGNWIKYSKIYKKASGNWIEQDDITETFDNNKIYILK